MKEKEALCKDITSRIDNVIKRLNELKGSAVKMIERGKPLEGLDEYTLGVLERIIYLSEVRVKRKKYVNDLLNRYKKERKQEERRQRERERTKNLLEGYRKEREEGGKMWRETREILSKARRELLQK